MNKIDLSNQKRTVFIEAYTCSDYGDGPQYARLLVDQAFCEKLLRLQKLCVENCLTELRICDSPDRWGPGEIENECRARRYVFAQLLVLVCKQGKPAECSNGS